MLNLTTFCRHPQDEPILQQLETYLQHQSSDNKAAVAIAALYEPTEPQMVYFDYMCNRHPKLNIINRPTPRAFAIRTLGADKSHSRGIGSLEAIAGGNQVIPQVVPFVKVVSLW